jgi:hypothetical protein
VTDKREDDRRNGDRVLADQVATLIEQMATISVVRTQAGGDEAILQRVQEHEQLMQDVPVIRNQVAEIIDVLDGQEHRHLDGTVYREGGMRAQMDSIYDDSQNGGIKTRIGLWERLFVAAVGAGGAVVGALIVAAAMP